MPPAPPSPAPDTLADSGRSEWQRADVFRAVLFGAVGVVYAVLMLPLTVAAVLLWLVIKLLDTAAPST